MAGVPPFSVTFDKRATGWWYKDGVGWSNEGPKPKKKRGHECAVREHHIHLVLRYKYKIHDNPSAWDTLTPRRKPQKRLHAAIHLISDRMVSRLKYIKLWPIYFSIRVSDLRTWQAAASKNQQQHAATSTKSQKIEASPSDRRTW